MPRAATSHTEVGTVVFEKHKIPFFRVTLGAPEDLPAYQPDVFNVVSALTIQAVHRHNRHATPGQRRPTNDLLFPFDIQRTPTGDILGARGLGRPVVRYRPAPKVVIPTGLITMPLHNANPFAADIYDQNDPDDVGPQHTPFISLPATDNFLRVDHYRELNTDLTEKLGVPVYDTQARGLLNDSVGEYQPGELIISNPNIPAGIGASALGNGARLVVLAKSVRSLMPGIKGQLAGGKALGMLDESVLTLPV